MERCSKIILLSCKNRPHYTILLNHGKLKLGIQNISSCRKHILPYYSRNQGYVTLLCVSWWKWVIASYHLQCCLKHFGDGCQSGNPISLSSSLTYNKEDWQTQFLPGGMSSARRATGFLEAFATEENLLSHLISPGTGLCTSTFWSALTMHWALIFL